MPKFIVDWYITEQVDRHETRDVFLSQAILEAEDEKAAEKLAESLNQAVYQDNQERLDDVKLDVGDIGVYVSTVEKHLGYLEDNGKDLVAVQADINADEEANKEP